MAASGIAIPSTPLTRSANFIGDKLKMWGEAAKDSPRIPDIVKDNLDKPAQFTSRIMPVLEKCDSALEGIIPIVNNKISTVAETVDPYVQVSRSSYAEGGIKQVTRDVCTKLSESPLAEDVKTAYADGGVRSVLNNILERVHLNDEDISTDEDVHPQAHAPSVFHIEYDSSTDDDDVHPQAHAPSVFHIEYDSSTDDEDLVKAPQADDDHRAEEGEWVVG